MSKVIFDRVSLKATGMDRDRQAFELEIQNVEVADLTKQVEVSGTVPKVDADGESLYALPQADKVMEVWQDVPVETTAENESPVMVTETKRVPLLDDNGIQKEYEVTERGEVTEVTDEPVMETVETENGETADVQKKDAEGNLLYWGQVGTGQVLKCWTVEEQEVQKKDEHGQLLYAATEKQAETVVEPQPDLEILASDDRYTDDLEPVQVPEIRSRTARFVEEPGQFTYEDIRQAKEAQLAEGTFYQAAMLLEQPAPVFNTELASFSADLGLDFLSLPARGEARTLKLTLPAASRIVGVYVESSAPLTVEVGDLVSTLAPLDKNGEVTLAQQVTEVYVNFKNPSDKRVDLHSFALMV